MTSLVIKKKGKQQNLDEHNRMMLMLLIMSSFKIQSTSDKCINSNVPNKFEVHVPAASLDGFSDIRLHASILSKLKEKKKHLFYTGKI